MSFSLLNFSFSGETCDSLLLFVRGVSLLASSFCLALFSFDFDFFGVSIKLSFVISWTVVLTYHHLVAIDEEQFALNFR